MTKKNEPTELGDVVAAVFGPAARILAGVTTQLMRAYERDINELRKAIREEGDLRREQNSRLRKRLRRAEERIALTSPATRQSPLKVEGASAFKDFLSKAIQQDLDRLSRAAQRNSTPTIDSILNDVRPLYPPLQSITWLPAADYARMFSPRHSSPSNDVRLDRGKVETTYWREGRGVTTGALRVGDLRDVSQIMDLKSFKPKSVSRAHTGFFDEIRVTQTAVLLRPGRDAESVLFEMVVRADVTIGLPHAPTLVAEGRLVTNKGRGVTSVPERRERTYGYKAMADLRNARWEFEFKKNLVKIGNMIARSQKPDSKPVGEPTPDTGMYYIPNAEIRGVYGALGDCLLAAMKEAFVLPGDDARDGAVMIDPIGHVDPGSEH